MGALAVTGASGFVGRKLVDRLAARGESVVAIARRPAPSDLPPGVTWISADIADRKAYEAALKGVDCVLHLAAITGKAQRDIYRKANVEGTRAVLEASAAAGVNRVIFVSSIAAAFSDQTHYHYGQSKIEAEALVKAAPMDWVIVRPTMIFGEGSPLYMSFGKLAGMPAIVAFGDGRVLVQPVHVDDVADVLAALARDAQASREVIEFGGPDVMSINDLLAKLRAGQGKPQAGTVHVPIAPVRALLAAVEDPLLAVLPFTAGQMASFANDGVAAPSGSAERLLPQRRNPLGTAP